MLSRPQVCSHSNHTHAVTSTMNKLPIILAVTVVGGLFAVLVYKKNMQTDVHPETLDLGLFTSRQGCSAPPEFLHKLGIKQPVMIDLSQKRFKGIAFYHGKNMGEALYHRQWDQFEHFGTYSLDKQGNMYLAPMPYISITDNTFELQKNLYKLDSVSGQLSILMRLDDVKAGPENPYGIYSLVYDCDDHSLWVAAIDETDYQTQKGVIYHIDVNSKTELQRFEGFDAITLNLLKTNIGKFLLAGSARDDGLYVIDIKQQRIAAPPRQLLSLASAEEHIRKIKIKPGNQLELQAIPFSYTLIAEASAKYRSIYQASWDDNQNQWRVTKKQ